MGETVSAHIDFRTEPGQGALYERRSRLHFQLVLVTIGAGQLSLTVDVSVHSLQIPNPGPVC